MPEGRSFPWKYLPRRNVHLSVTFGEPISRKALLDSLASTSSSLVEGQNIQITPSSSQSDPTDAKTEVDPRELSRYDASQETRSLSIAEQNWLGNVIRVKEKEAEGETDSRKTARIRSELTAVLQREVERLGRRILGRDHL